MKVTIIGAGIGGLTTAIALKQMGIGVELFENTPKFKKAGSGINLAINAMQVFKRLGLYDEILEKANDINTMHARTKRFERLTSTNFKNLEKIYKVKTVAIHRAVLHEILLKHVGDTKIHLNKKLKTLEQDNGKVKLSFEDGSKHTAEVVIGADGIHSAVRKAIFNNTELRDANQVCWRGISKAIIDLQHKQELNEIWGKGNRFGFVSISENETYWYALINKTQLKSKELDLDKAFDDYPALIKNIIAETPTSDIISNEIWDLKPLEKWYDGNVCLLGDAGHATTPNMGQGAVQAIESAMALSICLKEENKIEQAFERYQKIRFEKANHVIKTSWALGKIAQSDNAIICLIRNCITKIIPNSLAEKQTKKVFELNY